MRGAFAAIGCMLGITCTSGMPARNESAEEVVVHAPVEPIAPTMSDAPAMAPEIGVFWRQDAVGHAVPILRRDAPNMKYAAMDPTTCEAELTRRKVPFVRAEPMQGVLAPVRLRGGALANGVTIHSQLAPRARETSTMEIFDCRLVLALDDFSVALKARGIVEMIHLSAFRSRASFGCTPKYDGKQHCGALAVDIATFKRGDGTSLDVLHDYRGHVGAPTCIAPQSEIENIVCDAADHATFNVMLTPNFNAQHKNHVHVEITPDAAWMLVH